MSYTYSEQKESLNIIHKVLKENNFLTKMNLAFGTLLGAVRQGKLNTSLNNWDDLDFCVKQEDFDFFVKTIIPSLEKKGFEIKYVWHSSFNKIAEVTMYRGNDRLDVNQVFPFHKNGEEYYIHCHWYGNVQLLKGLKACYYNNLKQITLENLSFYGPEDDVEHLVDCYGDTWKTPCTSEDEYKYWLDYPGLPWWDRTNFIKVTNSL